MREDTPDRPDCPPFLSQLNASIEENREPPEGAVFLASLDPEVTKVCRVYLDVRVCLDFLVLLSRAKVSRESRAIPASRGCRASPDRREKLESWDFLAHLENGVTTGSLGSLEALENLVDLAVQEYLETASAIQEDQALKVNQESLESQVVAVTTAPPVTTAFQEVQVSPVPRGALVKQDVLESTEPRVSLDRRVRLDSQEEADQLELLVSRGVLEVLEPKVCLDLLV